MGTSLFGVNISGILYGAVKGKLSTLSLIKQTPTARDPGNLAAGLNPTSTSYPCEGFIEDQNLINAGVGYTNNDTIVRAERVVSIVGDSLPAGVVPLGDPDGMVGDKVTVAGTTYSIIRVKTDPAQAMYLCSVRR